MFDQVGVNTSALFVAACHIVLQISPGREYDWCDKHMEEWGNRVGGLVWCKVGIFNSMTAFAISGPPLYSFCMWLAMASTDFWYFAAHFAFLMSKVCISSPTAFITNSFFVNAAFLAGVQRNLGCPLTLGFLSNILIPYRSFF